MAVPRTAAFAVTVANPVMSGPLTTDSYLRVSPGPNWNGIAFPPPIGLATSSINATLNGPPLTSVKVIEPLAKDAEELLMKIVVFQERALPNPDAM